MMRSVAIYGGLLALMLGAAWMRWTAEPEPDLEGQIVLLQGDPEDIEKLVWTTEDSESVIVQKEDDRGRYLWVDHTKWKEVKVDPPVPAEGEEAPVEGEDAPAEGDDAPAEGEDAPAEEAPEPEVERVAEIQAFKAGEKGDELLASLSPMMAIRRLEGVDEEKLESIGLSEPTGQMIVVRKGRTATLDVGGEAFGTRDVYLRDVDDGSIYLVDDEIVRPLKYARTRLPDRTLFSIERPKIATATLADPLGQSLAISQKNADDTANALWIRSNSPVEEDEQLNTWMDQAMKLKGSTYAKPDAMPENLVTQFSLTLTTEGGDSETLEVLREGEDGDWWGRSEHTRGLIKLLKGPSSSLAEDVDSLLVE
jgi:hypothetical protein